MRTLKLHFADDALPTLNTFLKQTKEARIFRRAQAVRDVVQGQRLQTVSDTLHWSRSCRVRLISRYLSQAVCVVYISRSSVFKSSFLDLLQPGGPDRTHTCLTLSHDHGPGQLFTLHAAAATAAPETGALHAASRHGRSIRLPSPAYTASTA